MAMRLDKYLADMGLGTRSEIKKAVRSGRVSVDGRAVTDPAAKVGPEEVVLFDGTAVTYEPYVYYMLHKPAGVIRAGPGYGGPAPDHQ